MGRRASPQPPGPDLVTSIAATLSTPPQGLARGERSDVWSRSSADYADKRVLEGVVWSRATVRPTLRLQTL